MSNRDNGLVAQFIESAQAVGATVELIHRSPEELNASLVKATAEDEAVFLAQPDYLTSELFDLFLHNEKVTGVPTKETLGSITAGVTDAFCAVASTGSVCVSVSKNLGSPASYLTRKHIAVVDANAIVPRPRDVFSGYNIMEKPFARSFSFITGPSATADMGPLVIGVHGPGKLHIIVLE
ncbi:MAG TPA: LUD domain-containing protein [Candidatus Kryptobacter bacterium]|nr:MAG: hypothetical protein B7Z63_03655 [Ignavibacteriae bacterium 37-53-5]HQT92356.1 LUD domain-containing protein [Candidatus Kryptobacter bacterium]